MNIPLRSPLARQILAAVDRPNTRGTCRPWRAQTKTFTSALPLAWSVGFTVPVKVVSVANRREYWTERNRRVRAEGRAVVAAVAVQGLATWRPPSWPVVVTLTRYGGPKMDDDNGRIALKAVRDAVSKFLRVDDGDTTSIRWEYAEVRPHVPPAVGVTITGTV